METAQLQETGLCKHNTMQLKPQLMILSLTDEISMVGYQKFQ